MRDTLWAWNGCSVFLLALSERLWEHSRCLSSACIVVGAVTVTPAENFVSPLSASSPRVSIKKKKKVSVAARQPGSSSGSKRTFANPSKFLWTLRSTDWKWTAVDRRRGITAAEGHGASKSTGWPRQRCAKSPRLRQLAEWKETTTKKKIRSLFLHVLVQSSYILDVVGTFRMLGSSAVTRFWLCLTVSPVLCDSRSLYATSERHDLWQWCNRKAIEALAGRRPTARWCCLRKLVFVRLPLLP